MNARSLIHDFARRTGCGASPDADGVVALRIDGRHTVVIETGGEGGVMIVYAVIARLPPPGAARSAMAERLLELNLFGRGSGPACFALDPLEDEIILNRVLPLDGLEPAGFDAALEDFVTRLDAAGALLATAPAGHETPGERTPPPDGEVWIRG